MTLIIARPSQGTTALASGAYSTWCRKCGAKGWAFDEDCAKGFLRRHARCVEPDERRSAR